MSPTDMVCNGPSNGHSLRSTAIRSLLIAFWFAAWPATDSNAQAGKAEFEVWARNMERLWLENLSLNNCKTKRFMGILRGCSDYSEQIRQLFHHPKEIDAVSDVKLKFKLEAESYCSLIFEVTRTNPALDRSRKSIGDALERVEQHIDAKSLWNSFLEERRSKGVVVKQVDKNMIVWYTLQGLTSQDKFKLQTYSGQTLGWAEAIARKQALGEFTVPSVDMFYDFMMSIPLPHSENTWHYSTLGAIGDECTSTTSFNVPSKLSGAEIELCPTNGKWHKCFGVAGDGGDKYVGQFVNNDRHGLGVYYWQSGSYYVGNWENDTRMGLGTYFFSNGTINHGIWQHTELVRGFSFQGADRKDLQEKKELLDRAEMMWREKRGR